MTRALVPLRKEWKEWWTHCTRMRKGTSSCILNLDFFNARSSDHDSLYIYRLRTENIKSHLRSGSLCEGCLRIIDLDALEQLYVYQIDWYRGALGFSSIITSLDKFLSAFGGRKDCETLVYELYLIELGAEFK